MSKYWLQDCVTLEEKLLSECSFPHLTIFIALWRGLKVMRYGKGPAHSRCSINANFLSLRLTSPTGLASHEPGIAGGKRGGSS